MDESAQGLSGWLYSYKSPLYVSNKVLPFVTMCVCVLPCVCVCFGSIETPCPEVIDSKDGYNFHRSFAHTHSSSSSLLNKQWELGAPKASCILHSQQINTITFICPYTQTHKCTFVHNHGANIPTQVFRHLHTHTPTHRQKTETGLRPNG